MSSLSDHGMDDQDLANALTAITAATGLARAAREARCGQRRCPRPPVAENLGARTNLAHECVQKDRCLERGQSRQLFSVVGGSGKTNALSHNGIRHLLPTRQP